MAEINQPVPPHGQADSPFLFWRYVVVGACLSAALWFLSPYIQDTREPWDSPYFIYRGGLLFGGLLLGLLQPRPIGKGLASAWLGAWLGQIPFVLTSEFRTLGIIATAFGALFFAGGTLIGIMLRRQRPAT